MLYLAIIRQECPELTIIKKTTTQLKSNDREKNRNEGVNNNIPGKKLAKSYNINIR